MTDHTQPGQIEVRISDHELMTVPAGSAADFVARKLQEAGIPLVVGFDSKWRVERGILTLSDGGSMIDGYRVYAWREK